MAKCQYDPDQQMLSRQIGEPKGKRDTLGTFDSVQRHVIRHRGSMMETKSLREFSSSWRGRLYAR